MLHREAVPPRTLGLLTDLCQDPALAGFSLVGGTALALRFGHRVSLDLDFFTREQFAGEELAAALAVPRRIAKNRIGPNSAALIIDNVKVDFAVYRDPHLAPIDVVEGIRMWSVPDLISMKLGAICNRGAKRDFFDAHMLIAKFGLPELIEIYRRKFPENDPAVVLRSLVYFDDAESDADPVSLTGMSWPVVKRSIAEAARKML